MMCLVIRLLIFKTKIMKVLQDVIVEIGKILISDPAVQSQVQAAAVGGVKAVILVIKPYVVAIIAKLGLAATFLGPILLPIILAGVAVWAIAELTD